jgi:hypothetical protein
LDPDPPSAHRDLVVENSTDQQTETDMRGNVLAAALVAGLGASPAAALFPWIPAPFVKRSEKSTWTPPRETDAADANMELKRGWSPRPTQAPLLGRMDLAPRLAGFTMGANTCGFIATEWSGWPTWRA